MLKAVAGSDVGGRFVSVEMRFVMDVVRDARAGGRSWREVLC